MFVASDSVKGETGNGLSRRPSPTEKHKEVRTPIRIIERPKQDRVLCSLLIIYQ